MVEGTQRIIKANTELSWKSFKYLDISKNAFSIEVADPKVGLKDDNKMGSDELTVIDNEIGIKLYKSGLISNPNFFKADKINIIQTSKNNRKFIINDPEFNNLSVQGEYDEKDEKGKTKNQFKFTQLKLSGKALGDLVVEDTQNKTSIDCSMLVFRNGELKMPEKEKKKKEVVQQETYTPTEDYNFLKGLSGKVTFDLFNGGKIITMDILQLYSDKTKQISAYINIQEFIVELGNYLGEQANGKAEAILEDLDAGLLKGEDDPEKHYYIYTTQVFKSELLKLSNNPKESIAIYKGKQYIKLDKMIDFIVHVKTPTKKEAEGTAKKYSDATEKQINDWLTDNKNPMNPKITFSGKLDLSNIPIEKRGLMKGVDIDNAITSASINFDFGMNNEKLEMSAMYLTLTLPGMKYGLNNEGYIKTNSIHLDKIKYDTKNGTNHSINKVILNSLNILFNKTSDKTDKKK